MLELRQVSKTFRQKTRTFTALQNVDLKVEAGDIMGIIGSSGAGKSTLIRCVNLLEIPDSGDVIVNGILLNRLGSRALEKERKKIGMIFQHFNLLSSRTVFQNIAFPLELDHVDKREIAKKVNQLLEIVGLADKADEYPKNLSGGQKQRVAIARALANDPHLLLCDEATSALDPATTQSILNLLRDINQRLKITIVLITHEMEVVKSICNKVAVIDHGQLIAQGTLEQLLTGDNQFVNQFINSYKMTLPHTVYQNLHSEHSTGLFPVIEIELNGKLPFDQLIDTIYNQYKIPYKLIKAEIEYVGKTNFGKLLLHLLGSISENEKVITYLNNHHIKNTLRGYVGD